MKEFFCVKGCEQDPEVFYNTDDDCRNDCGNPDADVVAVVVMTSEELATLQEALAWYAAGRHVQADAMHLYAGDQGQTARTAMEKLRMKLPPEFKVAFK